MDSIDINCDLGEGFGIYKPVDDAALMKLISSCNIACGFHAGDPVLIRKTIDSALENQVKIGAHPSYPDLQGFGRRDMQLSEEELYTNVLYQVSALKGMVEALGGKMNHVKPHGALYNASARDEAISAPVYQAIFDVDPNLYVFGLPNSIHESVATKKGLKFIPEAFGDRRYLSTGALAPRSMDGAVINDLDNVSAQVVSIIRKGKVNTLDDQLFDIHAKTICIHSDTANSLDILKTLHTVLRSHKIEIKSDR
jgi:UPF0271 protein